MAVRISSKKQGQDRHIYVNDQQVFNDEGEGKRGLRADTLDGFHIDDIIAGIEIGIYRIDLSTESGYIFSPSNQTITIYAKLYKGTEDITALIPEENFVWTRRSQNAGDDLVWNGLHITGTTLEVDYNSVARGNVLFTCTVSE